MPLVSLKIRPGAKTRPASAGLTLMPGPPLTGVTPLYELLPDSAPECAQGGFFLRPSHSGGSRRSQRSRIAGLGAVLAWTGSSGSMSARSALRFRGAVGWRMALTAASH
jgi:hypothetical protein